MIDSMADLVKTVTQLSNTSQTELDKINGSAYLIRQQLEVQRHQSIWPWSNWLIKTLELIYSGKCMTCLIDFVRCKLKNYFESFFSRPRFLRLYRKSINVPGPVVCCGFHLRCASYGHTFFGGEVSLPGVCASQVPAPDWGAHGCLSAECCSGTLRHHAKICHSEIGTYRFLCNELVSLVKSFFSFVILYCVALKVQCHQYPKRNL